MSIGTGPGASEDDNFFYFRKLLVRKKDKVVDVLLGAGLFPYLN